MLLWKNVQNTELNGSRRIYTMKNKLLLTSVMIICLLCGCSANNVESLSGENMLEEENSTQSIPLKIDKTENLQKAETGSWLAEENNTNLSERLPEGYVTIPEQSFDIVDDKWGNVKFMSGYVGQGFSNDLRFYYVKNNEVVYEFPTEETDYGLVDSIQAVAFRDVTQDEKKDIIIIYTYYLGAGQQGMIPRTMNRIYVATEEGYEIDVNLENEIILNLGEEYSVDNINEYVVNR